MNRALVCSCPVVGCAARPTREFFSGIFGPDSEEMEKVYFTMTFCFRIDSGSILKFDSKNDTKQKTNESLTSRVHNQPDINSSIEPWPVNCFHWP